MAGGLRDGCIHVYGFAFAYFYKFAVGVKNGSFFHGVCVGGAGWRGKKNVIPIKPQ